MVFGIDESRLSLAPALPALAEGIGFRFLDQTRLITL